MLARRMFDFPSMGRRHPFAEMERMARRMDWLTNGMRSMPRMPLSISRAFPAVNIAEDHDNYYVRAELPGVKAEDLKLEVAGQRLAISGERRIASEGEKARCHRREREAGKFTRVIRLPGEVDAAGVNAKLADGVLTVTIGKPEAVKPKKISVNAA